MRPTRVLVTFVAVAGLATGLGFLVGHESNHATSTSLAWCLYGAGMIMVLVAIPRSEPRQYDQERQRSGLRETVGTALSLALGVLLIAVGIVIQTRRS